METKDTAGLKIITSLMALWIIWKTLGMRTVPEIMQGVLFACVWIIAGFIPSIKYRLILGIPLLVVCLLIDLL